jgi:hypothetical protein
VFERAFTYKTSQGEKGRIAGRKKLPAGPPRTSAAGRSLFCCLLFVLSVLSVLSAPSSLRLSVARGRSPSLPLLPLLCFPMLLSSTLWASALLFRCGLLWLCAPIKEKAPEAAASEAFWVKSSCRRDRRRSLGVSVVGGGSFRFHSFFPPPLRPVGCQKSVWLSSPRERAGRSGWPSRMRACERAASVMRLPESILAISVVRSSAVSRVMEVRPSRL